MSTQLHDTDVLFCFCFFFFFPLFYWMPLMHNCCSSTFRHARDCLAHAPSFKNMPLLYFGVQRILRIGNNEEKTIEWPNTFWAVRADNISSFISYTVDRRRHFVVLSPPQRCTMSICFLLPSVVKCGSIKTIRRVFCRSSICNGWTDTP